MPARLDFLCQTLGLHRAAVAGIRYQLLHRTASAILEAQRFGTRYALTIIRSSCPDSSGFADFEQFAKLLGVSEVEKAPCCGAGCRSHALRGVGRRSAAAG